MYSAKSIDELYEEVKEYDLVICNDAPLALALNNRLDKPRVGAFAITPRQLAGDLSVYILKQPILSDVEIVRRIAGYTGYPLRFVHGEVENIKTIRRYTFEVEKYLFSKKTREIYNEFIRLPTLEKAMDMFDGMNDPFYEGKNVAVIGEELFDSLDKHFIPLDYKYISLFKDSDETFSVPEFRELSNDRQIAENAVSLIKEGNASDVAIVLDVGGKIADAVRSELYREGHHFINELSMRDLNHVRDYIEFLNRSHDFSITKVSQIRDLIQSCGGKLKPKTDEYLIERYQEIADNERAVELFSIMENVSDYTYGEVYQRVVGSNGAQVKMLLNQLNLTDVKLNPADTADIIYAVHNFDLKHNEQLSPTEKDGVLIVDCKKSMFIDRPVVIYLGMGQEWEKDLDDLNLIDHNLKDDIINKNVTQFQVLLQQGTSRIYICNSTRRGKEAKPCRYFDMADKPKKPYKKFSDVSKCIRGPWYSFTKRERGKVEIQDVAKQLKDFTFSATSLNQFLTCPRKFMYSNIVDSQDAGNKAVGIYLHHYAEFRTCFPEEVDKRGREFFVQYISERCTPLFPPEVRKLQESKIRFAVSEFDELIEKEDLSKDVKLIPKVQGRPNPFFEMIGKKDFRSDRNEVVMIERDRHMYGKMDLVIGSQIYDFKTGRAKDPESMKKVFKQSKNNRYGTDIQCLFYLSLLDDNGIKNPTLTLFSTSANESNLSSGLPMDYDIAMTHIRLVDDMTMMREYLPVVSSMNRGNKYDEIRDRWGEFIDALTEIGLERALSDPAGVAQEFYDRMDMRATSPKKPKDALDVFERTMINANKALDSGSIVKDNTLVITSRQMEAFREKVRESYDSVQEYYGRIFPMVPMMDCKHCDCKDMCTELKADGDDSE